MIYTLYLLTNSLDRAKTYTQILILVINFFFSSTTNNFKLKSKCNIFFSRFV